MIATLTSALSDEPANEPVRHNICVDEIAVISQVAPAMLTLTIVWSLGNPLPVIVNKVPPPVPPLAGDDELITGVSASRYLNVLVAVCPFSATLTVHTESAFLTTASGTVHVTALNEVWPFRGHVRPQIVTEVKLEKPEPDI